MEAPGNDPRGHQAAGTTLPPVAVVDAGGLVPMILEAARTVRRDRARCRQLARQVLMVGDLLRKLRSMGVMQDPRVAIPLEGLDEALQQAHTLVVSCQCRREGAAADRCFAFALGTGRRRANQFRKVHEDMGDYLRLFPSVSHVDLTRRLEHLLSGEAHAPSSNLEGHGKTFGTLSTRKRRRFSWQCCWPGKEKQRAPSIASSIHLEGSGAMVFQFSQLSAATNNFSPQNEIGRGGFGAVYKGQMQDGLEVAVKRCSTSGSDSDLNKHLHEFRAELELLTKLHHNNIVKLLGYCTEQRERILVYEYILNGSLDKFIYGMGRGLILAWPTRIRIIKGIAQGIIYLHEQCGAPIVHGDIKSNNILLDSDLNPKITDFGTARVITPGAEEEHTETLQGTVGYFAPEYFIERIYSVKSDVYSFGVVLIEIIAGKRRVLFPREGHSTYIHEYARELWNEGRPIELIDPRLPSEAHINEILRCIQIGLLCVEKNRDDRPSMRDVILMLTCESISLRAPSTNHSDGENQSLDCVVGTTSSRVERSYQNGSDDI